MKKLLALIIISMATSKLVAQDADGGTVVISKRIGENIYVGVDSRVTWYRHDGRNDTSHMCKIVHTDLINMAFQGLYITQAKEIAIALAGKHKDLRQFMQAFVDTFSSFVYQRMELSRLDDFPYYLRLRNVYPKNFNHLLLFGNNKDTIFNCMIAFRFESNLSEPVSIYAELVEADLLCAGHITEIQKDLLKSSNWDWNPFTFIEHSIKKAEKYHTSEVGGDVNVVLHRKGRFTWRYRRNSCAAPFQIQTK